MFKITLLLFCSKPINLLFFSTILLPLHGTDVPQPRQMDVKTVHSNENDIEISRRRFCDVKIVLQNLDLSQNIERKHGLCVGGHLSPLCLLQNESYRVEDKCICRRWATTATRAGKEALGLWGSPRRLESPWCCSSPPTVGMHWCTSVPPAVGFWTCLLLLFSQVLPLLTPVPVRLQALQSRCTAGRVSLTAHTTSQSAASFLDQSTSKLFPAPKPSRQGGGRRTLYIQPLCTPRAVRRATAAVTATSGLH
jgi:hypothetical protein